MANGRGWTRRRAIGALALAGGGALLAACGGSPPTAAPPPSAAPPSAAPQAVASPTATAAPASGFPARPGPPATPATVAAPGTPAVVAATPIGTPGTPARPGPAGTPAGSPTPTVAINPDLARLLALVPQRAPLPGLDGVWFADVIRQKRNYGFADVTTLATFERMPEERRLTFNNVMAALPLPEDTGRIYTARPDWRVGTGFDFWQVDRAIQAGSPPQQWLRLEGGFNRAEIAGALEGAGHKPVAYGGETILTRGGDGQLVELSIPLTHYTLARLNRVVLENGAFSASGFTALIQAGIDARAGRLPSFAADPDYAALAAALGPIVGAILAPADAYYGAANPSARPTPTPTPGRTPTVAADRLPRYNAVGLGLRDDGKAQAMVIALAYADQASARTGAAVLLRRLEGYRLGVSGQRLSERAAPGDADLIPVAGRIVVVAPLTISDEPSLSLWLRMYANGDYRFLAE